MFKIRKQANLHIKKNNQLFLLDKLLYKLSFVSKLRRFSLSLSYNNFCVKQYKNRSRLLQTVFPDYISKTLLDFSIPTLLTLKGNSNQVSFLILNSIFKKFFNSNSWLFSKLSLNFNYFFYNLLYLFHSRINSSAAKVILTLLLSKILKVSNTSVLFNIEPATCTHHFHVFKAFKLQADYQGLIKCGFNFSNYIDWPILLDSFFKIYRDYLVKFSLQPKYFSVVTKTANHMSFQDTQTDQSTVLAALN